MDASQLFFDHRSFGQDDQSQKQVHSDFMEIPEAPSHFEAPELSSQRCFSDIHASQLYHSSHKTKINESCLPGILSTQQYGRDNRNVKSLKSVPNILASQLYCSTREDIDLSTVEFPPDKNVEIRNKKTRFISPVVPLFTKDADLVRKSLNGETPMTQKQSRQKEQQTPGKTPACKIINKNLAIGKDTIPTPMPLVLPSSHGIKLRSIEEIPEKYRDVFEFPYFNIVQSRVFDEVFYTDKPLVVSAPTGAGKTTIFELAIVRLLMKIENHVRNNFKVVYMAPIKALCSEKFLEWKNKFEPYNLKCAELTGDTEVDDYYELQEVNIILTTPEKWDSMTRRWRDNMCFVQSVCLFCIDEIHVLNDSTRGATIEAVISRMKTIQAAMSRSSVENFLPKLRFVAVSATIPNIDDIAEWLGDNEPAVSVKMDDSLRPVRLRKVVLGFYFDDAKGSSFHFDLSLNYKLAGIINTYSENKPTLVFCSTRKSTQQAGETIAKDTKGTLIKSIQQKQKLLKYANMVKDNKLRDLVMKGIGFHHAGMDLQDRKYMEELFACGDLPVLVATSTLAMGVNLPAHLVILKSTQYYNMGYHEEYSDTQILQMIGRAGRPQFDTTATAVIMTKNQTKAKYEDLLNGTQVIESSLHKHLVEHLNAEIVLHTINDISIAMEWIRYTFLYIRVMKNPKHYGMPLGVNKEQVEKRLQDLCMKNLNELESTQMITMDEETFDVKPTEAGRLMARYCVAFDTMKKFCKISGTESASDLINLVAECEEFAEIQLRTNEKRTLNTLNKDKNRMTIRFPLQGKIKTKQMKVNVLIQAAFGSLTVQDFSLQQDTTRIFRAANRVSRCLLELLWLRKDFKSLLSSVQLSKSFKAKLWEDSKYITKQLDGIGPTLSNALVNAGITTFQKLEETNPRELELIVNRHPPFGNQIRDAVSGLPKYELTIEQVAKYSNSTADLWLHLNIANKEQLLEKKTTSPNHTCVLLIGDEDNKIVYHRKIMDAYLIKDNGLSKKLEIIRADKGPELFINLISQEWVGIDVQSTYTPFYNGPKKISSTSVQQESYSRPGIEGSIKNSNEIDETTDLQQRVPCSHSCMNKRLCGHDCCRNGIVPKTKKTPQHTNSAAELKRPYSLNSYMSGLKNKLSYFPATPNMKRLKLSGKNKDIDLNQFAYNPRTPCLQRSDGETHEQLNTIHQVNNNKSKFIRNNNSYNKHSSEATFDISDESLNGDCQIMDDDWADFDAGFDDNNLIPVTGDHQFGRDLANNGAICKLNGLKNSDFQYEQPAISSTKSNSLYPQPVDRPCKMGDNSSINMDWAELDMYQKKREDVYEDYDYELPDLDRCQKNRDEYEPANFQLQSSLLPTQYKGNNTVQTTYKRSSHPDRNMTNGYNDTKHEEHVLPQSAYTTSVERKPPLTPHRYGQVLAWSKTSRNCSPDTDWSGSDNEMITAEAGACQSDSLFNRDKEILNKHVENISSRPWKKQTLKQQCQGKENIPTPSLVMGQHKDLIGNKWKFQRQQECKSPALCEYLPFTATDKKKANTSLKSMPNKECQMKADTVGNMSSNVRSSSVFSPSIELRTTSRNVPVQKTSLNSLFLPENGTIRIAQDNPQDTFNSIFDGIF